MPSWTSGHEATLTEKKVELTSGFEVSVSKMFVVPVERLFEAWSACVPLRGGFNVYKATADKTLWATWVVGTNLEVNFYSRGEGESQMTVHHGKLNDTEHAAAMKEYWRNILHDLALSDDDSAS